MSSYTNSEKEQIVQTIVKKNIGSRFEKNGDYYLIIQNDVYALAIKFMENPKRFEIFEVESE